MKLLEQKDATPVSLSLSRSVSCSVSSSTFLMSSLSVSLGWPALSSLLAERGFVLIKRPLSCMIVHSGYVLVFNHLAQEQKSKTGSRCGGVVEMEIKDMSHNYPISTTLRMTYG